jgi:hypothetical protein
MKYMDSINHFDRTGRNLKMLGAINPPSICISHSENAEEVVSIEVSSKASAEELENKLKKRVKRLLKKKGNKLCMDCGKPHPRWASLLVVPSVHGGLEGPYSANYFIGGFCCLECSGAHRRLGTHLSFVRSVDLDTLKENEVEALELGGNEKVNKIFERNLKIRKDENKENAADSNSSKPDPNSGQKARESYIREKYEKKRFLDIKALANFRQFMINRDEENFDILCSPLSGSRSSSSQASPQLSPLQQLQIFTSSPRTLAMIEKYMNPKPKKKVFRKMKFSFKRFSRKRRFKGDIRNIRGLVNTNPNLHVVETRSDYLPSPTRSDLDCDDSSYTSAHSSMSAAIRRRLIHSNKLGTPTNRWVKLSSPTKKKVAQTPTPRKGYLTPTPRSAEITPSGRRTRFSFKHNYACVDSDSCGSRKDVSSPSPASSTDSSRFSRFTGKLRTPRPGSSEKSSRSGQKNKKSKKEDNVFFGDETSLGVLKESGSTESDNLEDEIKAMKAWSNRFDKIIAKVFKKKKTPRNAAAGDEQTLLGGSSGSSDSNK